MSFFLDLEEIFMELNEEHFDSALDMPAILWNSRFRSSAGRFTPGIRRVFYEIPPKIEVASYLREEKNRIELIRDTIGHEMIHYWLWLQRKPYGHTRAFHKKMKQMGVSRYNLVPKSRPYKYLYQCGYCTDTFQTRRKMTKMACAKCCNRHNNGRYDHRFVLKLLKYLEGELS